MLKLALQTNTKLNGIIVIIILTIIIIIIIIIIIKRTRWPGVWGITLRAGRPRLRDPRRQFLSIHVTIPVALDPEVYSASKRNECQIQK
jgi:hypothetical protein